MFNVTSYHRDVSEAKPNGENLKKKKRKSHVLAEGNVAFPSTCSLLFSLGALLFFGGERHKRGRKRPRQFSHPSMRFFFMSPSHDACVFLSCTFQETSLSLSLLFLRLDDESIFRADNCILTYLARPSPILIGNTPMRVCVRTSIVRSVLFICLIFFLLLSFSSAFVQVRSEELHFEEYD